MKISKHILVLFSLLIFISGGNSLSAEFNSGKLTFSVKVRDTNINYSTMTLFVLPEEELEFEITTGKEQGAFDIGYQNKIIDKVSPFKWQIKTELKRGLSVLTIRSIGTDEIMRINIFVVVPYTEFKGEYLNGYHIGKYPTKIFRSLTVYKPPKGFIEISAEMLDLYLTPHFQLRQFICKQESGYPKYAVIRTILLIKLELILEKVNEKGYRAETFNILSAYRTPFYNKEIGNVKYSRHQWGDAADFFIDEDPKDDMMDDLNKDGKINWKDAAIIYDIIDDMYGKGFYKKFIGGLGRYKKSENHGPFVHTDVRGYRARWGD